MNTKITNEVKVAMKKGQLKILQDYFKNNEHLKDSDDFHKTMYATMLVMPEDIERFEQIALMDKMFADAKKAGKDVPEIVRVNSEERSLEEMLWQYRHSYKIDPTVPMLGEHIELFRELIKQFKTY